MRKFTKSELIDFKFSNYLSFDDWYNNLKPNNTAGDLLRIMRIHLRITNDEIKSSSRKRKLVDRRMIIAVILYNKCTFSYSELGRFINRDHATIMHYLKKHKDLMATNVDYRNLYIECLSVVEGK